MKKIISTLFAILIPTLIANCGHDDPLTVQGYIEGRFTYVASSVSGHLQERFVNRGQQVKAGEKLYVLDPLPQSAELEQAKKTLIAEKEKLTNFEKGGRETVLNAIRAQVDQANADLALAKLTLNRRSRLVKKGAISQSEYDDAYADYQIKKKAVTKLESDLAEAELGARTHIIREQAARVQAFKAEIKQIEWQLSQKTGIAPVNGLIFDTFFRKGEFVAAGQGILAMLAPQNIYLVFYIPEPLLSSIKVGQHIYFKCDGCKKQLTTIYFISPSAEYTPPVLFTKESRRKLVYRVEARIPIDKAANFHPGQPVDVMISRNSNAKD